VAVFSGNDISETPMDAARRTAFPKRMSGPTGVRVGTPHNISRQWTVSTPELAAVHPTRATPAATAMTMPLAAETARPSPMWAPCRPMNATLRLATVTPLRRRSPRVWFSGHLEVDARAALAASGIAAGNVEYLRNTGKLLLAVSLSGCNSATWPRNLDGSVLVTALL
jgi:hypothetical protein